MASVRASEATENMVAARLSLITYNLWLTERWPARAAALERFLKLFVPDVLCVQELQRPTQEFLDGALKSHDRVRDPFSGWTNESNFYWSKALFEDVEYGAQEVGHPEPERRMFWVRLRFMPLPGTIFVSTAHLTNRCLGAVQTASHKAGVTVQRSGSSFGPMRHNLAAHRTRASVGALQRSSAARQWLPRWVAIDRQG